MARYRGSVVSGAALSSGTAFAALTSIAAVASLVRRITVGWTSGGAAVTASQQAGVGVGMLTTAGTTSTAIGGKLISPNGAATSSSIWGTWGTYGTFSTTVGNLIIPLNNQSAADLSWEEPDQWYVPPATTNGIVFYASQTFPSGCAAVVTVEWEE